MIRIGSPLVNILFAFFRLSAAIRSPQRAVILRCPPNPPASPTYISFYHIPSKIHIHVWYSFWLIDTIEGCSKTNRNIFMSVNIVGCICLIVWCEGVKLSGPVPVRSSGHLSVRRGATKTSSPSSDSYLESSWTHGFKYLSFIQF